MPEQMPEPETSAVQATPCNRDPARALPRSRKGTSCPVLSGLTPRESELSAGVVRTLARGPCRDAAI